MTTHENLYSNAATLCDYWGFTSGKDVLLHALPIFHTHGLFTSSNTILAAGALYDLAAPVQPRSG